MPLLLTPNFYSIHLIIGIIKLQHFISASPYITYYLPLVGVNATNKLEAHYSLY
jgi:hypothetical protein